MWHKQLNCIQYTILGKILYIILIVSDVPLRLNEQVDSIQMISTFQNDIESILGKYTVKAQILYIFS